MRKDKLIKHIRETQHQDDAYCPFPHCNAEQKFKEIVFKSRKEIVQHYIRFHTGNATEAFECRLGSCKESGDDKWSSDGFITHLCSVHGLEEGYTWGSAYHLRTLMDIDKAKVLTEEFRFVLLSKIPEQYGDAWEAHYHDCDTCIRGSSDAQPI